MASPLKELDARLPKFAGSFVFIIPKFAGKFGRLCYFRNMKRQAQESLSKWLRSKWRKPLILRGARQVGKSTLVRQFAAREKLALWELNLERHTGLAEAFARMDVAALLQEFSLLLRTLVGNGPGVLFLDEIQAIPAALACLRYFHEERPDLPVIAAGSLLEFALDEFRASMPVGRLEFFHLGPVSFEEFLQGVEGDVVADSFRSWNWGQPWPDSLHQITLSRLRDFLGCGGMPEAAAAFAETKDLVASSEIQRSIVETYREDFSKYTRGAEGEKVRRIFDIAPTFLGQKVRWNRIHPSWKSVDQRHAFDLLARAGVLVPVHHCDGMGVPLSAGRDENVFKLLHLDVGLAQSALGGFALPLELFRTGRFINEGPLAEQFVGQQLRYWEQGHPPELHYWLREGRSGNAEVDFLVAVKGQIVPVEVKSGAAGAMRSLHQFMALRKGKLAVRFDLNPPSHQTIATELDTPRGRERIEYTLLSLPLPLAGRLPELLDEVSIL